MGNSILDRISEAKKEEKEQELKRQSEEVRERAHEDEVKRREYEAQLRRERAELIKIKQGLSDGEEFEEEPKEEKVYTFKEKVQNFFYHNKFYVIAGACVAAVLIILTVDYFRTVRPDIPIMFIAEDYEMNFISENITDKWSSYTPDLNHDRKSIVKMYYVPAYYKDMSETASYLVQADRTKLVGEFQSGTTVLMIGNERAYKELGIEEGVFADGRELFPGDPNADKYGYRVSGTDFKELVGAEDLDDSDLYFSFRIPVRTFGESEEKMRKNYDNALNWFKAYLTEHRKEN